MRTKILLVCFAFVMLIASRVFSQYEVYESFDYPIGSSPDTLLGTAGNGWGGSWDMFDGNYEVMTIVDTGFAYDDLNYTVSHTGGLIMGANPSAWGWQRYGRYLDKKWPNEAGKIYWMSCLYELKNYTNNGWALVSVYDSTNERAGIGHEWGNDSISIATYNTMGHSGYLTHDGPQWLVAKMVMSGDSTARVFLWVSPDPKGGEPDTTVADARGTWNIRSGFNRIAVHWGGEGVGMTMAVDEIRLGTTWDFISAEAASGSVVKESFDYSVGTSVDTLLGTAGGGWGGPWDLFEGNYEVMTIVDTGFAYDDLNYTIGHTGGLIMGANPSAWGYQRYGRYLDKRWTNEAGKVYWLSCLYELKNYTNNGWALVSVFDGTHERAGIGHEWGNDSIGVATYNTLGHSGYLTHDGPQWLVAKVVMTGDTLGNRVFLWVTPDPEGAEPDTVVADARGNWRIDNGFDRIVVHWGGEGVGMTMAVDEIRLGNSWNDMKPGATAVEKIKDIISSYELKQNYPNPFNPTTKISFNINYAGKVRLNVYNLLGQLVSTLVDEELTAGTFNADFNAAGLPSGIYFYKLEAGNTVLSKKMILLK